MVKISVIIPVFNCEKTIGKSIHSVQKQTIKDIEIVCVDDGSTDCSAEIIQTLQKNDERIMLYMQNNQGSGAARNLGMSYAQGEFIAFLDADDYYLDADALESMLHACKEQGVPACGTNIKIERGGKLVPDRSYQEVVVASQNNNILKYQDFQFDYGYYGFIFERKLIADNKVQFPLYRRFQDPVFLVKVMNVAKVFCFLDKTLYVYRAPNVLSRFQKQNTVDLLRGLLDNLQFAVENDLDILFVRTLRRVEEEYADIIYCNLSVEGLSVLLEINQLVKRNTVYAKHTIVPIIRVLDSVSEIKELTRRTAKEKIAKCKKIYLYGAGQACIDCIKYLKENKLLKKVRNILVTSLGDNPTAIGEISVMEIDNYQFQAGDLIIVTVAGIYQREVIDLLEDKGISNFELMSNCVGDSN